MAGCNLTNLLSPETFAIVEVSIHSVATGVFAVFGIFSNVMNIIVFYRQGILSSSSIVNLTGLAVADLFNCIFAVISGVTMAVLHYATLDFVHSTAFTVSLIFAAHPLDTTVQLTCWITAVVAFERAFCVVFPFKAKSVFTPMRSLALVVAIFIGSIILSIPVALELIPVWNTHPVYNYTYMGFIVSDDIPTQLISLHYILNPIVLRFTAIFIVLCCNIVLFWKVSLSTRFRKQAAGSGKELTKTDKASSEMQSQTKEMKLLKMITVISTLFVFCYSTYVLYNTLYNVVWIPCVDVPMDEQYIAWDVSNFFQIVNSSTNFIIYYTMSSRFKEEFDILWKKVRDCKS